MALPTFIGKGTSDFSSGAITVVPHASTVDGMLVIYVVETNAQALTATGWTAAGSSPQTTGTHRITVLYAYHSAGLAYVTSDSGDHQIGNVFTFDLVLGSGNPFDVTNGDVDAVGGTAQTIPTITTVTNDCLIFMVCGTSRDANSSTNFSLWTNAGLANLTEREDLVNSTGGGGGFGAATGEMATAGVVGTTAVTAATADVSAHWIGAILPVSASPDPGVSPKHKLLTKPLLVDAQGNALIRTNPIFLTNVPSALIASYVDSGDRRRVRR